MTWAARGRREKCGDIREPATGPFEAHTEELAPHGYYNAIYLLPGCSRSTLHSNAMQIPRVVSALNNTSSTQLHQPFCHNDEGWGPLSLLRYDFTPCFVDVPHALAALFGIVLGSLTIWWLSTKASKQPTEKDWHYYTKLVWELKYECFSFC
jgi:hypothetical protein